MHILKILFYAFFFGMLYYFCTFDLLIKLKFTIMKTTTTTTTTTEIKRISVKELANLLTNITKSTFCSLTYIVDDNRSKQVKGKKQVQKMVFCKSVALNHNYQNKVNNLNGTTDFIAQPLKGKFRVCSTLLGNEKTNELMIDGKILNTAKTEILGYFHNGNEITELEAIAMELWTNSYFNPTEKITMGRGSVSIEDDFYIINTYLKSIVSIKLEGTFYEIV